jgi:hypothetical protein
VEILVLHVLLLQLQIHQLHNVQHAILISYYRQQIIHVQHMHHNVRLVVSHVHYFLMDLLRHVQNVKMDIILWQLQQIMLHIIVVVHVVPLLVS